MSDQDKLMAGLREWAAHKGDADLAAFELLAWHEYWLRRADFRKACVHRVSGYVVIRWGDVQGFAESSPHCSTSELNVLRIAAAIGADIFGFSGFGRAHRRAVARAFASAAGLALEPAIPEVGHSHPDFIPGDPATCHRCALDAGDNGRPLP